MGFSQLRISYPIWIQLLHLYIYSLDFYLSAIYQNAL